MKKPLKVAINRYSEAGGNSKQTLILFWSNGSCKKYTDYCKVKTYCTCIYCIYCTACLMDKMYMYNIAAAHFVLELYSLKTTSFSSIYTSI